MKSAFYQQIAQSNAHRHQRDQNCEAALASPQNCDALFALCFDLQDPHHFKACWALELVLEKNLSLIAPHLSDFCRMASQYRHDSAIRSVSKIVLFLAQKNTVELTPDQEEKLIETALDWLIQDEKVAAKAYAMRALYHFGKRHPWIHEQLKTILTQDYPHHSPAYKGAAKDLLKRLK